MNDRQLVCFLTVSRTMSFSAAARELFLTQPALSYQIRSLEKELEVTLFKRSTTNVELTEGGEALLPAAMEAYRYYLELLNAARPFSSRNRLVLRLPPVLLQQNLFYSALVEQLGEAFPQIELTVVATPVAGSVHRLISTGVDAAVLLPAFPTQPEVDYFPLMHTSCYLVVAPGHRLFGRTEVRLDELAGEAILYESASDDYIQLLRAQLPSAAPLWKQAPSFKAAYAKVLAGQTLFISAVKHDVFPAEWHLPVRLARPLPDICLATLCDDPRPAIVGLRQLLKSLCKEFFAAE